MIRIRQPHAERIARFRGDCRSFACSGRARGFSVVATEIRRMAVQSRDSSKDIRTQLGLKQNRLKAIGADIDRIKGDMAPHSQSVKGLDGAFEHIAATAADCWTSSRRCKPNLHSRCII